MSLLAKREDAMTATTTYETNCEDAGYEHDLDREVVGDRDGDLVWCSQCPFSFSYSEARDEAHAETQIEAILEERAYGPDFF